MAGVQKLFGVTSQVRTTLTSLLSKLGDTDATIVATVYVSLIGEFAKIIEKIHKLPIAGPASGLNLPLNTAPDWEEFSQQLTQHVIVNYLETYAPLGLAPLVLLGVVDETEVQPTASGRVAYVKKSFHWDTLIQVITSPRTLSASLGSVATNIDRIFARLNVFLKLLAIPSELVDPSPELIAAYYGQSIPIPVKALRILLAQGTTDSGAFEFAVVMMPVASRSDPTAQPDRILITTDIAGNAGVAVSEPPFTAALEGGFQSARGIMILLESGKLSAIPANSTDDSMNARITLDFSPEEPVVLVGTEGSDRLEISSAKFSLEAFGPIGDPDLRANLAIKDASLVIDTSKADSFIQKLLGSSPRTVGLRDFGVTWSSKTGLSFEGSVSLQTVISINKALGPFYLDTISLGFLSEDSRLLFLVAMSGRITFGPLTARIDKIGIRLTARPHLIDSSKEEPLDSLPLALEFKPPEGLGIVIDTAEIRGGGFLSFDEGRYAGIMQLEAGGLALMATALLETKLPSGRKGFSLLAVLGVQFDPPFALGYGFSLKGVGGLVGIHRTINLQAVQEGVRSGAIDSVLFPEYDPIANAQKLLSDIGTFFPAQEGRHVFGPMAIITWGVPTIVTAQIAVLVEFPAPIRLVVLGQLQALLPDRDLGLVKLSMNVAGVADLAKRTLSVDASLYDSQLLSFPLEGDMALRAGPGYFALAVGGVHPAYPSRNLPSIRRLKVSIGNGNNPRLNLQTYLALTENTVQFGARFELYAEMSKFEVQGVLGFDTIFFFSPFRFTADIYSSVDLLLGGESLMSVKLDFTLQGPTPWRARGKAKFKIGFVKFKKSFDKTFGRSAETTLPALDPWPEFVAALDETNSWLAVLPSQSRSPVVFAESPVANQEAQTGPQPIVCDGGGALVFRQKVVPLGIEFTRFGNARTPAPVTFDVSLVGSELNFSPEMVEFPPGQFWNRTDSELLTAGVELHKAGIRATGHPTCIEAIPLDVYHEDAYKPEIPDEPRTQTQLTRQIGYVSAMIGEVAKARCAASLLGGLRLSPVEPRIKIADPGYAIVRSKDLTPAPAVSGPLTWTGAVAALHKTLLERLEGAAQFRIVPQVEAAVG